MTREQVTAGALVVAAAIVLAVAVGLPPPTSRPTLGQAAVAAAPAAGSWTCVTGAADGTDDLRVLSAVPSTADQPSTVRLREYGGGEVVVDEMVEVDPATTVVRQVDAGSSGLSTQRWSGAPAVAGRVWWSRSDRRPTGVADGPCSSASSDRWVLPALSTGGGDVAELRLANPHATDAAVAVRLLGTDGTSEPVGLANVAVPAGEVVTLELNEVAPERAELAAEVVVRSGRVVVEGLQAANAAIGGVDGLSAVTAAPRAASTWSFPWFEDREGAAAAVSIVNTGDATSVVSLSLQTDDGGRAAATEPVEVLPGTVRRVPLDGLTEGSGPLAGLTLDVQDGPPVTAAVVMRFGPTAVPAGERLGAETDPVAEDGEEGAAPDDAAAGPRSGLAVLDGATAPADEWVLFGATSPGRDVVAVLANPTGAPATVTVDLAATEPDAEAGTQRLLDLAPGSHVVVPLDGGDGETVTVLVRASLGSVVAALRGVQLEGPLYVSGPLGVPATAAPTVVGELRVLRDPTLLQPALDDRGTADEATAGQGRTGQ